MLIVIMSSPVRRSWPRSISWWVRPRPGWRWCGRRRSPTATDGVMVSEDEEASGRYIVVKALEDGVVIMGLTRGKDTRSHHSERLDAGEVLVAQFTELTAAIKIRGKAEIMTDVGMVRRGQGAIRRRCGRLPARPGSRRLWRAVPRSWCRRAARPWRAPRPPVPA